MKTNKSSAECAKYNKANANAIDLGLMEGWEPTEQVLAQEAKARAELAAGTIRLQNKLGLIRQIWQALPANVQAVYTLPTEQEIADNPSRNIGLTSDKYGWSPVVLESYSSDQWSRGHSYYRVVIGSYGDKSILKLNPELTITPAQIAKVVAKIVEQFQAVLAKQTAIKVQAAAHKRRDDWLAVPRNNDLAKILLGTTYIGCSDFQKIEVYEDGRIRVQFEVLMQAQWEQVANLRVAQRNAMKALMDSFKPAPATR